MHFERHRAPRRPFVAGIDLTDLQSEQHLVARTKDLSLFKCYVETATPFPELTEVRLRISHAGVNIVGRGKVAHSRPGSGMGIAFIAIEPSRVSILDAWLENLRR